MKAQKITLPWHRRAVHKINRWFRRISSETKTEDYIRGFEDGVKCTTRAFNKSLDEPPKAECFPELPAMQVDRKLTVIDGGKPDSRS